MLPLLSLTLHTRRVDVFIIQLPVRQDLVFRSENGVSSSTFNPLYILPLRRALGPGIVEEDRVDYFPVIIEAVRSPAIFLYLTVV